MKPTAIIAAAFILASTSAFACGGGRVDPGESVKASLARIDTYLADSQVLQKEREGAMRFNGGKPSPELTADALQRVRALRAESALLFSDGLRLRERAGRTSPGAEKSFGEANAKADEALKLLGVVSPVLVGVVFRCGAHRNG